MGGTAALGAMTAFRGESATGGFGGSPAWAPGSAALGSQFNQGGRNQGRGGEGGKPGQAIMHSFRKYPLTTCHKCGQNGHIERSCPT